MPSPGPNVTKLFTSVVYECLQKAIIFLGKLFQTSLMFVGKPGAYLREAPFRRSTLG
jgi:hypothetical protein